MRGSPKSSGRGNEAAHVLLSPGVGAGKVPVSVSQSVACSRADVCQHSGEILGWPLLTATHKGFSKRCKG